MMRKMRTLTPGRKETIPVGTVCRIEWIPKHWKDEVMEGRYKGVYVALECWAPEVIIPPELFEI